FVEGPIDGGSDQGRVALCAEALFPLLTRDRSG
ncbi:MAG: hypothetical protein QOF88_1033, partial [Mycobacterium sp.]|nr:hypothetical protein [Mycobacterium sp.]